jgi:hypothetical protein
MNKWMIAALACLAFTAMAMGAGAVEIKTGQAIVIQKGQPVDDDILAAASEVAIAAPVQGDIVAAGKAIVTTGAVKDSVMLAGRRVTVAGPIGNDSWLAGETTTLDSTVADNAFLAGSEVTLSTNGGVGRDMLAAGEKIRVLGKVGRDLRVAASEAVIGGTVGRDVYAQTDSLIIQKTAVIKGNLWYEANKKATIEPGAKILGKTIHKLPPKEKAKTIFWSPVYWVLTLLMAIVFGGALLMLFPSRSQATADTVRAAFGPSIGIGLAALILTPALAVVLLITIIGIPIGLSLLAVYGVLLYAAWILGALALGQWILGRAGRANPARFGSMILGILILAILGLIPFVGGVFKFVAALLGLGALLISWWRDRTTAPARA